MEQPQMRRDDLPRDLNDLSREVITAAIAVHKSLGPGLLEKIYCLCLHSELVARGIPVQPEVPLDLTYRGRRLSAAYRLDLLVDERLIVEVKSAEQLEPVHLAQLRSYLRLSELRLGLLVNFNEEYVRDGIRRVVN